MGVQATFFAESRTLREMGDSVSILQGHEVASHAVEHEDLTGEGSGVSVDDQELRRIIVQGREEVKDLIGVPPVGFRAPYQHVDGRILDMLMDCGFRYDSSLTLPIQDGVLRPHRLPNGLCEFPVAEARDVAGKRIVSYLWPMHEGRRKAQDYMQMMDGLQDGLLVMATHTWHMTESYARGALDLAETRMNLENVRSILEHALDSGMEVRRLDQVFNAGR
jgi:peptidoglycan/xylan/chitin deacetylase (PgdA/CDA1 family)